MSTVIREARLRELAGGWIGQGTAVAAPVQVKPGLVQYARVLDAGKFLLDGFIRPANSIKEYFFPRHEKLYEYRVKGRGIELIDAELSDAPQLILGAHRYLMSQVALCDDLSSFGEFLYGSGNRACQQDAQ